MMDHSELSKSYSSIAKQDSLVTFTSTRLVMPESPCISSYEGFPHIVETALSEVLIQWPGLWS